MRTIPIRAKPAGQRQEVVRMSVTKGETGRIVKAGPTAAKPNRPFIPERAEPISRITMDKMLVFTAVLILSGMAYFAFQPEPPFSLKYTAVDGTQVDVANMRGKVVLVDFWATWCGPCREEVPNVVAAYQQYHDKGFEVVGISLDTDQSALLSFTSQSGMTWPQYFDGKGWSNSISSRNGVYSIPAMWLIGKDGKVITKNARADLAGQVEKALAAP